MRNYYRICCVIFLATLLGGCVGMAHYATTITSADTPSADRGYIYGRFTEIGDGPYMNIGLKILRVDNKERTAPHIIQFTSPHDVNGIAVVPGRYVVSGVIYTNKNRDGDNFIRGGHTFSNPALGPFQVEAGKLYYLGDFVGEVISVPGRGFVHQKWRMTKISYNPKETSKEFFDRFPSFRDIGGKQ